MEHNHEDDLWQGGPWEQPSPVFTPPPPVEIPRPSPRAQRPVLRTRRRGPRWPWITGLAILVLALCGVALFLDQYVSPSALFSSSRLYPHPE